MTIAIQGEWGSGKSSLMYYLMESLSDEGKFEGIWINSWEYALFNDDTGALLQIVTDITNSLIGEEKDNAKESIEVVKGFLKKISKTAMVIAGKDYKFIDELIDTDSDKKDENGDSITIADIKKELENIINLRLKAKKDKEGLIFL